jgi:hypothetical protein
MGHNHESLKEKSENVQGLETCIKNRVIDTYTIHVNLHDEIYKLYKLQIICATSDYPHVYALSVHTYLSMLYLLHPSEISPYNISSYHSDKWP